MELEPQRALASAMQERGYRLCTGGTDNHLMLVDLRPRDPNLTGADAEKWLEAAGVIVNKNGIPNDPRPPMVTSGIRIGTPAATTRGFKEAEVTQVADLIADALDAEGSAEAVARVREQVTALCRRFPVYESSQAQPRHAPTGH